MTMALIFGSRVWADTPVLHRRLKARIDLLPDGTLIVEGGAIGADALGGMVGADRGLFVAEVDVRRAHYRRWGNVAPFRRNEAMAAMLNPETDVAEGFYAAHWPKRTGGSHDMERRLAARGVPTTLHWLDHTEHPPQRLPIGEVS